MAYCVHCGVKLGDAEKACPLCETPVIDPTSPQDPLAEQPFPIRTPEQTLQINRRYAISLLSLLLLIPAGLCLLIDLFGGRGITWSVYPAGVLVLIWIAATVPLLARRYRLYSSILATGGTLAAYLYMVEQLSGAPGWFLPIVLPALAVGIAMTCFTLWLIRNKRLRLLRLAGVMLVEAGLLCLLVELLCVWNGVGDALKWSPYVIMPCAFIALLLYVISRNGPLSSELKRRFHF